MISLPCMLQINISTAARSVFSFNSRVKLLLVGLGYIFINELSGFTELRGLSLTFKELYATLL